ncbi:MAG: hypothetical protein ACKVT1_00850 [Dehalococcoidia bacterium]
MLFPRALTRSEAFLADVERMLTLSEDALTDLADTLAQRRDTRASESFESREFAVKWSASRAAVDAAASILQFAAAQAANDGLDADEIHKEVAALVGGPDATAKAVAVKTAILRVASGDSAIFHEAVVEAALGLGCRLMDSKVRPVFVSALQLEHPAVIGGVAATFHYHEPGGAHKDLVVAMTPGAADELRRALTEALDQLRAATNSGSLPILNPL